MKRARDAASRRALFSHVISHAAGAVGYSTVTDFARLRGWSTFEPRFTAM